MEGHERKDGKMQMITFFQINVIQTEVIPYTVLETNFPCEVLITENLYKPILHGEVPLFNVSDSKSRLKI